MKDWRTAKKKDFARIIEDTRQAYNKTLDKGVLIKGLCVYNQLELFPTSLDGFILELRKAGLKRYPRFFEANSRICVYNFLELPTEPIEIQVCDEDCGNCTGCDEYDCNARFVDYISPEQYILELQTGANKKMLPIIEKMVEKKLIRLENEKWEKHPCNGCSGEDCACCEIFYNL